MQPEVRKEIESFVLSSIREKIGHRLFPFLEEVLALDDPSDAQLQELQTEHRHILELLDRFERRLVVEIELNTSPEGLVDVEGVHRGLDEWTPEEESDD